MLPFELIAASCFEAYVADFAAAGAVLLRASFDAAQRCAFVADGSGTRCAMHMALPTRRYACYLFT